MPPRKMAVGEFSPEAAEVEEVCSYYKVSPDKGLSDKRVLEQRAIHGTNELAEEEGKSLFALILEQFDDQLVKILLAAAMVSFLLAFFDDDGEQGIAAYVEPLVILIILILNAIVGVYQEKKADNALEALKKLQPDSAMTMRNGRWEKLEAADLVPGDVVEVGVGRKYVGRVVAGGVLRVGFVKIRNLWRGVVLNWNFESVPAFWEKSCGMRGLECGTHTGLSAHVLLGVCVVASGFRDTVTLSYCGSMVTEIFSVSIGSICPAAPARPGLGHGRSRRGRRAL